VRETLAVCRKELRAYLVSPIPYVLVAIFAGFTAWWVFEASQFLLMRQANLQSLFQFLPWALMVLVPALAMRGWSEEIRGGTLETLMTFPARARHLVLGKFLAGLVLIAACLLSTIGIAITAASLGNLDWGPVFGGYLGMLAVGAAFLALGFWLSSLTRNQIVAFILGLVVCFAFTALEGAVGRSERDGLVPLFEQLAITTHSRSIARGVVDFRDVFYFVAFIGFFLYLNVETIENRRHK
jgi:ABC-2 type transport system permease protein